MTSFVDRIIAGISPSWAVRRAQSRRVLAYYEAAKADRQRKQRRETGSGDTAVLRAGRLIREQARHLEQNHDLARGAINLMVANIAGANGITIEPQPRTKAGDIHAELAEQIRELWADWIRWPDVTWEYDWAAVQRVMARAWLRDGEVLAQFVDGASKTLDHGTVVPFSIEMIEADHLPFEFSRATKPRITAGVERNDWGRPIAYHIYRDHPGDMVRMPVQSDLKRVSADRMLHLKLCDRSRQARGVSAFASVMGRLDDIKDYEESERVAAKVAASMAAVIKKGQPDLYEAPLDADPRDLKFRPGMIFDDLLPGESIETIDAKRPNPNVESFRSGQLRAVSAGIGCTYSSLAKDYDGTYSSQRQELVEGWGIYSVLQSEFTGQFVRPVYERFISVAMAARLIKLPSDLRPLSIDDALFIGPQMPWIDPIKEAKAWGELERNGHASGPEIIRRRGQNPIDVLDQESRWREQARDRDLVIAADPANDKQTAANTNGAMNARLVRNPG